MSADVELQNISVTFGNFYAAKNVSVKINEGEAEKELEGLILAIYA